MPCERVSRQDRCATGTNDVVSLGINFPDPACMRFDVPDRVEATRHLRGGDGIGGACAVSGVGSLPWALLLLHALWSLSIPPAVGSSGGRIKLHTVGGRQVSLAAVNQLTLVWIRTR